MKRRSAAFQRDWRFYRLNSDKFTFAGEWVSFPHDPHGTTAEEAFFALDSQGKHVPCRQHRLLEDVVRCKKAINLQIKMWAGGYEDMAMGIEDYLQEFIDPPDWIEKAIRKAVYRA